MYFPMSDMPRTSWCSPANPQGSCKPTSGVCKPMDRGTLETYRSLQSNLNKVLAKHGKSLVDVDGRIGTSTRLAVNTIMNASYKSCDQVAINADVLLMRLRIMGAGLPTPPPPSSSRPSVALEDGTIVDPPGGSPLAFISDIPKPIVAAIGVGAFLFFVHMDKKGKKAGSKKSSTAKKRPSRRKPKRRITQTYY